METVYKACGTRYSDSRQPGTPRRRGGPEVRFRVTVKVEGLPDWTTEVDRPDEWKARTAAMAFYPHSLRGQFVDYDVEVV